MSHQHPRFQRHFPRSTRSIGTRNASGSSPSSSHPVPVSSGVRKERGKVAKPLLWSLILLLFVTGIAWGGWRFFSHGKSGKSNVIFSTVTRGTFVHEITGKGDAESAKNIDVTCQVENNTGTTIIWIIPEGETVTKGQELVLLDSSDLEDKVSSQQITCNSNSATVASSQASLRTAELSLEEYIEGTFEQNWMTIENELYSAREEQKQAANTVAYTKKLVQFGYTTTVQLEENEVAEQKQINTVKSDLLKQLVLLKYTSEKEITQLMAGIETARAKLSSDTYTAELSKNRLDYYLQQLENCVIRAPQNGQVVYANQESRYWSESEMIKEGASVRARQVLIRLPDRDQMQVKAMINESNISYVKEGMKAKIYFDAFSSQAFDGTVVKVNQYPEIVWMSSSKDYVTIVKVDHPTEQIRSGLTAQVRIEAKRIPNVLTLPVHCIVEVEGKKYVITYHDGVWGHKEVKLGESNDKQVIIEEGLEEGEVVVSGARQYKVKAGFKEAPRQDQTNADGIEDPDNIEKTDEGDGKPGAPGGDGKPNFPQGAPSGDGKPNFPQGAPGGDGKPSFPQGAPGGDGKPNFPQGAPGGDGKPTGPDGGKPRGEEFEIDKDSLDVSPEFIHSVIQMIRNAERKQFERLESLKGYFDLTAMELCQKVDTDFSKSLTREEIAASVPECEKFFDQWDRSKKGVLTRTDLVIGFCSARINYQKMSLLLGGTEGEVNDNKYLMKKEIQEIMALLDHNGDNALTEEDLPDEDAGTFRSLLKFMDKNEDGRVNAEEFSKGITRLKQQLSQQLLSGDQSGNPASPAPPR